MRQITCDKCWRTMAEEDTRLAVRLNAVNAAKETVETANLYDICNDCWKVLKNEIRRLELGDLTSDEMRIPWRQLHRTPEQLEDFLKMVRKA